MPHYTYPGAYTVKNKLGETDVEKLERREARLIAARQVEIEAGYGPKGQFDADHLKAIHRHLFQDVYEWSGHTRDEPAKLSDGTVATEPILRKQDGKDFLIGNAIPGALNDIADTLRDANHLQGLSREEFAKHAADIMADLNAIHPFREGNGRTQRVFVEQLAQEAGHTLDFTVVSKERMIQASIAANERGDPSMMRRMFNEISDQSRVEALREATEFLGRHDFPWNDLYVATAEPGHQVELTMAGFEGEHFMARTSSQILIGKSSDLSEPYPDRGEAFTYVASEHCWAQQVERQQREQDQSSSRDPAITSEREAEREAKDFASQATKREMTDAKAEKAAIVRENDDASVNRKAVSREFKDDLDRDLDNELDGDRERGR